MGRDDNLEFNPYVQVDLQPNTVLGDNARKSVVGLLNIILADEALLTIKTRSSHWNTHGANFLELHTLYDIQYMRLNAISDEIAERVRMLGGFAINRLQEFLDHTRLGKLSGNVTHVEKKPRDKVKELIPCQTIKARRNEKICPKGSAHTYGG